MTDEIRSGSANSGEPAEDARQETTPAQRVSSDLLPLPALAGIALYMMVLAGVSIVGVASRQFPALFLVFSAFFIISALGLLRLKRWAWALALSAVVLLVALFTWKFITLHQYPFLVQGMLNLVFFLYLVRTEVRSKLR
jgi:uncharacterized membrane protein (DUF2068 family)